MDNATPVETMTLEDAPVLDVADVIALEQAIAQAGTPLAALMRTAGRSVAEEVMRRASGPCTVCVLAGSGNNGGDGWMAAEFLANAGYRVSIVTPYMPEDIKAQPAHDAAIAAVQACGDKLAICVDPDGVQLDTALDDAAFVIDALLGTGFSHSTVRDPLAAWIEAANSARVRGAQVIAVDVASGLSAQDGFCAHPCIQADATITMMVAKPGLMTEEGRAKCGTTVVARIHDIDPFID